MAKRNWRCIMQIVIQIKSKCKERSVIDLTLFSWQAFLQRTRVKKLFGEKYSSLIY